MDILDPLVGVGCGERCGDDGKFAFAAGEFRGSVHQLLANSLSGGLIDEKRTSIGLCIGIIRYDFDAGILRFFECCRNAIFVFASGGDHIDTEGNPVFNDFILFRWICVGRAIEQ